MGLAEVNRIKAFFTKLHLNPEYLEHPPVKTSIEAAKTRRGKLHQGIKSILFTNTKDEWVIVNVPADRMVDKKKVAAHLGWPKKKIRLATPNEVLEQTGCEIGSVPPLCHKNKIPLLVDPKIYNNQLNAFNIGLLTHSVRIKTEDIKKVYKELNAIEGDFAKEV